MDRYMSGGGTGKMTMDELHMLEKNLEVWIDHIRSVKVRIILYSFYLHKFSVILRSPHLTFYVIKKIILISDSTSLTLQHADGYHVSRNPAAEE